MTRRARRSVSDPRHLAALTGFARGYLHQDVIAEHGSVAGAAAAFCRGASPAERRALADALQRVVEDARGWRADRLARFFERLGAAWSPSSIDDLRELAGIARGDRRG
jgi:hypothetical protein